MRIHPLLAALLAAAPCGAIAQTDAPMELGIPGEVVLVQPSAFTSAEAVGPTLLLQAHPGFTPVIIDFARDAGPDGISISICGTAHPPFQPTPGAVNGTLHIFLGDAETAQTAAAVLSGDVTCADVAVPEPAVIIDDLLPTPSGTDTLSGLTIASPSDTYDAMVEEVMEARAALSPHSGQYGINLTFGPGLALWFGTETQEHLGEPIELLVCGSVLTAPRVQEAILGGEIQLTGNYTKAEAEEIAARIRGDIPCGG